MCLEARRTRLMTAVDPSTARRTESRSVTFGPDEAELPDLAQRLDGNWRGAGCAGDHPEAHIVLEQLLADVAADEAAAAEYRHEAWGRSSRCH